MGFQIKVATMRHYAQVNEVVREGQDEHAEALPTIFKKVDQVMPEDYFAELLKDPFQEIFIAVNQEEVVGFAVMELKEVPPFDSLVPRKVAYMNDFGIKKTAHRNGIGRELFSVCKNWGKEMGANAIELTVWEFNKKAIQFYEEMQMEIVSRKMSLPL